MKKWAKENKWVILKTSDYPHSHQAIQRIHPHTPTYPKCISSHLYPKKYPLTQNIPLSTPTHPHSPIENVKNMYLHHPLLPTKLYTLPKPPKIYFLPPPLISTNFKKMSSYHNNQKYTSIHFNTPIENAHPLPSTILPCLLVGGEMDCLKVQRKKRCFGKQLFDPCRQNHWTILVAKCSFASVTASVKLRHIFQQFRSLMQRSFFAESFSCRMNLSRK